MENYRAKPDTKLERLFLEYQGLLQREQVVQAGLDPHLLTSWVKEGRIERVQRGLYRFAGAEPFTHETLLEVALRVPSSVVCLRSALAFHQLGTGSPAAIDLAIPTKGRTPRFDYPPVRFFYFSDKVYHYGLESHEVGPREINVYSPEKTLADLLFYRTKLGNDIFIEGLQDYVRGRPDLTKLLEAARIRRVTSLMRLYLEPLL